MLDKIEASSLPDRFRIEARRLRAHLPDEPVRVQDELGSLWAAFAANAAYESPKTDLFRCVPALNVRRWMAVPAWRHADDRSFLAAAEASGDPVGFVRAVIPRGQVIFPPDHCWLIDAPAVVDMTSRQLRIALELGDDQRPPFVVFRLSLSRMQQLGIAVRIPTALDAAAGGQPQWTPSGLQLGQEYVDRAVPIEAVEDIVWKP